MLAAACYCLAGALLLTPRPDPLVDSTLKDHPAARRLTPWTDKKQQNMKNYYAQPQIVVKLFRVNLDILTSKFWFSYGLISKMLV